MPKDNLLGVDAGTYSPAIDDGFYVTLAPLGVGQHTIHVTGATAGCPLQPAFSVDVTYHLTVVPVDLR
jgi:hypothetical protein